MLINMRLLLIQMDNIHKSKQKNNIINIKSKQNNNIINNQPIKKVEDIEYKKIYKSSNSNSLHKNHKLNKKLLFQSLQMKRIANKSQLIVIDNHIRYKNMDIIQDGIAEKDKQILDDLVISYKVNPKICNINFDSNLSKNKGKQKVQEQKFNSTQKKLYSPKRLQPIAKIKYIKQQKRYMIQKNPQQDIAKFNGFTPGMKKLDYTKPTNQVFQDYFNKLNNSSNKITKNKNQLQQQNLTSINHLEQLQKLKYILLEYQMQHKYENYHKIGIKVKDDKKFYLKNYKSIQFPKKNKSRILQQKQYLEPWGNQSRFQTISSDENIHQQF